MLPANRHVKQQTGWNNTVHRVLRAYPETILYGTKRHVLHSRNNHHGPRHISATKRSVSSRHTRRYQKSLKKNVFLHWIWTWAEMRPVPALFLTRVLFDNGQKAHEKPKKQHITDLMERLHVTDPGWSRSTWFSTVSRCHYCLGYARSLCMSNGY